MGFTHYTTQNRHATATEWDRIIGGWAVIRETCERRGIALGDAWGEGEPEADENRIAFNGAGETGYESCVLTRRNSSWTFCKTDHQPYDLAVVALYALAHTVAPRAYTWDSDGDTIETAAGCELARLALAGELAAAA